MEAGMVGEPAPWPLVKAWLCRYYGCLPSQLADEPADEVLHLFQLDQTYQEYRAKRPGSGPSPLKKLR